ncbi:UNKNOWN [Stylonychia lemnae]|uniref:Uncharacterized protein n=1 Tax=Stylonychia lemnae TaxID=5949 RepID=A0A077ZUX8_STYLE|nr:UNKNOWN [Stylonychia lemnae]|eukprot:CDW73379.1 UNKNOWN [Stylonychia lemnae]
MHVDVMKLVMDIEDTLQNELSQKNQVTISDHQQRNFRQTNSSKVQVNTRQSGKTSQFSDSDESSPQSHLQENYTNSSVLSDSQQFDTQGRLKEEEKSLYSEIVKMTKSEGIHLEERKIIIDIMNASSAQDYTGLSKRDTKKDTVKYTPEEMERLNQRINLEILKIKRENRNSQQIDEIDTKELAQGNDQRRKRLLSHQIDEDGINGEKRTSQIYRQPVVPIETTRKSLNRRNTEKSSSISRQESLNTVSVKSRVSRSKTQIKKNLKFDKHPPQIIQNQELLAQVLNGGKKTLKVKELVEQHYLKKGLAKTRPSSMRRNEDNSQNQASSMNNINKQETLKQLKIQTQIKQSRTSVVQQQLNLQDTNNSSKIPDDMISPLPILKPQQSPQRVSTKESNQDQNYQENTHCLQISNNDNSQAIGFNEVMAESDYLSYSSDECNVGRSKSRGKSRNNHTINVAPLVQQNKNKMQPTSQNSQMQTKNDSSCKNRTVSTSSNSKSIKTAWRSIFPNSYKINQKA